MTEPERDERVLRAYRELGGEVPPAARDAAILAAARRRGARWQVPLAAAAALVLAVGLALVVEREAPRRREDVALKPQVMSSAEPGKAGRLAESRQRPAPAAAPSAPASEAAAPTGKVPERLAKAQAEDRAAPVAGLASGMGGAMREDFRASPERWLERIAELRQAGRNKEADQSLAEFRRRYPEYRIPEKMRARVLPR